MFFRVTRIDFDFSKDGPDGILDATDKQKIYDMVINLFWEVDNKDDLLEKISEETGWGITEIEYVQYVPIES